MNNKDIIVSSNKTIAKYSSDVVKRGLDLATLIENKNDIDELHLEQGVILYKAGEYEKAVYYFNKIAEIDNSYLITEACELKGMAFIALKSYNKAIASYSEALRVQPQATRFLELRADLYASLKRYTEALNDFEQILCIQPDLDKIWLKKGFILNELQNYQEAIISYDRALKIKPDYYETLILKGQTLEKLGKEKEAFKLFFEAAAIKVGLSD